MIFDRMRFFVNKIDFMIKCYQKYKEFLIIREKCKSKQCIQFETKLKIITFLVKKSTIG